MLVYIIVYQLVNTLKIIQIFSIVKYMTSDVIFDALYSCQQKLYSVSRIIDGNEIM